MKVPEADVNRKTEWIRACSRHVRSAEIAAAGSPMPVSIDEFPDDARAGTDIVIYPNSYS
jgi:hypothetical protein